MVERRARRRRKRNTIGRKKQKRAQVQATVHHQATTAAITKVQVKMKRYQKKSSRVQVCLDCARLNIHIRFSMLLEPCSMYNKQGTGIGCLPLPRNEKQLTIKAAQAKDLPPPQLATALANVHPSITELALQELGGDLVCLRG